MPQQFENPANVEVHRRTTAQEILRDFADAPLDALITGVGTGGHITGCAEVLKQAWPELKVFAVEPTLSPVLSGGAPGPHPIQGIGAGFIPAIMDVSVLDGVIEVDPGDAEGNGPPRRARGRHAGRHLVRRDPRRRLRRSCRNSATKPRVLGFNYDTGERYLSVPDFLPEQMLKAALTALVWRPVNRPPFKNSRLPGRKWSPGKWVKLYASNFVRQISGN